MARADGGISAAAWRRQRLHATGCTRPGAGGRRGYHLGAASGGTRRAGRGNHRAPASRSVRIAIAAPAWPRARRPPAGAAAGAVRAARFRMARRESAVLRLAALETARSPLGDVSRGGVSLRARQQRAAPRARGGQPADGWPGGPQRGTGVHLHSRMARTAPRPGTPRCARRMAAGSQQH